MVLLMVSGKIPFGGNGLLYVSNLLLADGDPLGYRQWVTVWGIGAKAPLPIKVSTKFFECVTHCGTAPSINAIPLYDSYQSSTYASFTTTGGDSGSLFLLLSIGV